MSVTAVIGANAVSPVGDHQGPCQLVLSQKSITVSVSAENGTRDLGTWPFDCIRRFHSQDQCYFSFTSGRRGPFGVHDYTFQVKEEDLAGLQSKLTHFTGAKFDSPRLVRNSSGSRFEGHRISGVPPPLPQSPSGLRQSYPHPYSHAHLASVSPSSPTTSSISPTNIHDHPQPVHSYITTNVPIADEPVVVPKVPVARNGHVPAPLGKQTSMKVSGAAAESKPSSGRASSKLRSAFSMKTPSTSHVPGNGQPPPPSTNVRNSRYVSTVKQPSSPVPFQHQSSAFKQYSQTTLTQGAPPQLTNSALEKDRQSARRTPSPQQPMSGLAAVSNKQVGQRGSPPLPRRSEEVTPGSKGKKRAMMSHASLQEYDTLSDAQEATAVARGKLSGSHSPRRSESPKSNDEEIDNVFPPTSGATRQCKNAPNLEPVKVVEIDNVELRSKKSPSPSAEPDFSSLDKGSRLPPTKNELRQLKKLSREPLVNVSAFTQQKRNTEYVDIDLPSDRNSDSFSENSESLSSSLYSVPSSLPAFPLGEQVYDIPTAANPRNLGARPPAASDPPEHYDVPSSALIGGGSRLSAHVAPIAEGHYDTPRLAVLSRSKSPPQRALPHLPDDYVNVVPRQFARQVSGKSKSESEVEDGDGLYSEIPAKGPVWGVKIGRVSSAGRVHSIRTSRSIDIYSDFDDGSNPNAGSKHLSVIEPSSHLEVQGDSVAKKLADAGYEFVHPAISPALVSPPAEHAGLRSPFSPAPARSSVSPTLENVVVPPDEYIELHRESVAVDDQDYMNVSSFQVNNRRMDDYEVIGNGGLKTIFSGTAYPQQQLSGEVDQKTETAGSDMERTRGPKGPMRSNYMNVGVGFKSHPQKSEEVKARSPDLASGPTLSRTFNPSQDRPEATPSKPASTTPPPRAQSGSPTALVSRSRNLSDVRDILEYELVDEDLGCASPNRRVSVEDIDEEEYMVMRPSDSDYIVMRSPVARSNSSSSTGSDGPSSESPELPPRQHNARSSNPVAIPEKILVPTAAGSPIVDDQNPPRLRKRSLTIGDPLDGVAKGPKKHTYINIPEPSVVMVASLPNSSAESSVDEDKLLADKKPMPLPRQASLKQCSPPLVERRQELVALHQTSKTLPSIPLDQNGDKNGRVSPPKRRSEVESPSSKVQLMIRQFSGSCSPSTSPCTSPESKRKS